MAAKPRTIDEYLATLSAEKRAALEKLRKTIQAAAPRAEECISYQLPAFRQNGPLVAFGASAKHYSLYPMSSATLEAHAGELAGYDTSPGTIRFRLDEPLPVALVRKLVKARLAENAGRAAGAKKARAKAAKRVAREAGSSRTDPAVGRYLRELDHPLKRELETVRQLVLGVSPEVREGIKWNSPSFRTTEWFATINVHDKEHLRLILHTGAKVKASATKGLKIADPTGLLRWLAKDRCLVTLGDGKDIRAKRAALQAILLAWIRQV